MDQPDLLEPAAPEIPVRVTTKQIRDLLHRRYPAPEWATLEEVAPRTGGGTGYADAVTIGLYASRGHPIYGFEIKVSRGDWLRELKQPAKAEGVYAYCDGWWIVAPKGVVKDGELPMTWGLLEATPSMLKSAKSAPKLKPRLVDRHFFASLIRRAHESIDAIAGASMQRRMAEARAEMDEAIVRQVQAKTRDLARLEETVAKFKSATGLDLDPWRGPPIELIRMAQRLDKLSGYGRAALLGRLETLADQLEVTAKSMREIVQQQEDPNG